MVDRERVAPEREMTPGTRLPTWKERENNKRRERRRRAIAAKIFAGLRTYGNYKLPKHCDNNEVLKALCAEAGWTVEEDGRTCRKGTKPPVDQMEVCTTPASSVSPTSSSYPGASDGTSLIRWLKGLSAGTGIGPNASTSGSTSCLQNLHMVHGCNFSSAPVTPPLSSPKAKTISHVKPDWDTIAKDAGPLPEYPMAQLPFSQADNVWSHHTRFLAAAAASNQSHLRPGSYCELTPDGCRTPAATDEVESDKLFSPTVAALKVSNVFSSSSTKWANGIRVVQTSGSMSAGADLEFKGVSGVTYVQLGSMRTSLAPSFPTHVQYSDSSMSPETAYINPWHQCNTTPSRQSAATTMQPVPGSTSRLLNPDCKPVEISGTVVLQRPWPEVAEDHVTAMVVGRSTARPPHVQVDELELTLGCCSSSTTSPESQPQTVQY